MVNLIDTEGETVYSQMDGLIQSVVTQISGFIRSNPNLNLHYDPAISHIVHALQEGFEPIIAGKTVLRGTELIFARWEAARQGGKVTFPLEIEGNPLLDMYDLN